MVITERAELLDTGNVNDYPVSAFTPNANTVLVAWVHMSGSDGSTVGTFDDAEGDWTKIRHQFFDTNRAMYAFWRKVDASPVSITPTFHCADAGTGCGISILEFDPTVLVSGDPIRQSCFTTGTATQDLAFTFASAVETANGYGALIRTDINPADCSPPTGWTEHLDLGYATPTIGLFGCHRAGGETTNTFTATAISGITAYAALGVEVLDDEPVSSDPLVIQRPKHTKLTGSKRFPPLRGLRAGLFFAPSPVGGATVVSKAVRPTAITRSRSKWVRLVKIDKPGSLKLLGDMPVGGGVISSGTGSAQTVTWAYWIIRKR